MQVTQVLFRSAVFVPTESTAHLTCICHASYMHCGRRVVGSEEAEEAGGTA